MPTGLMATASESMWFFWDYISNLRSAKSELKSAIIQGPLMNSGLPPPRHSMLRQDLNKKSKARVKIYGFLYPNIFLSNNQRSLKSCQIGNIENFSKEVLFRLTTFFFRLRKIIQKIFLPIQFFMYWNVKKIFRVIRKNFEKIFFQKTLSKFWKKNFG